MARAHSRRPSMAGCKVSTENHRSGDSFGAQNRFEPSPDILSNVQCPASSCQAVK